MTTTAADWTPDSNDLTRRQNPTINPNDDARPLARLESLFSMPTISMFFGLIVRMYYAPDEHPPPHFHVYYGEFKARINIQTCEMIDGNLPRKQLRLALAWAELHQEELLADWALVMSGEEPFRIAPLQ